MQIRTGKLLPPTRRRQMSTDGLPTDPFQNLSSPPKGHCPDVGNEYAIATFSKQFCFLPGKLFPHSHTVQRARFPAAKVDFLRRSRPKNFLIPYSEDVRPLLFKATDSRFRPHFRSGRSSLVSASFLGPFGLFSRVASNAYFLRAVPSKCSVLPRILTRWLLRRS